MYKNLSFGTQCGFHIIMALAWRLNAKIWKIFLTGVVLQPVSLPSVLGNTVVEITWSSIRRLVQNLQGTRGCERQVLLEQPDPISWQGEFRDKGKAGFVYGDFFSQAFVTICPNTVVDKLFAQGLGGCSVNC